MPMPQRAYVTNRTDEVFAAAHTLADQLGHEDTTPLHLTLGMLLEEGNMAAQIILYSCRVPRATLQQELTARLPASGTPRPPRDAPMWSASDEQMLAMAAAEARELGDEHLGCEHLLLAFLRDSATGPGEVLAGHGVRIERVQRDVRCIHDGTMVWAGPAT